MAKAGYRLGKTLHNPVSLVSYIFYIFKF